MSSPVSRPSPRVDPLGAPWPGLIPLRPQTITDILSGATRLVARRAGVLVPVALAFALAGAGVQIGLLSLFPVEQRTLPVDWAQRAMAGQFSVPVGVIVPTFVGTVVSVTGTMVVASLAAAFLASDVLDMSKPAAGGLERMRGRWPAVLGVALIVAVACCAGLVLLVVPGAIALATLSLALAVVPMERASIGVALRRAVELSAGMRLRIFGVLLLALVITSVIGMVVESLVPIGSTLGSALAALLVGAVVASLTTPWVSSVLGLLYIDTRIRKENLAGSLIRATYRN